MLAQFDEVVMVDFNSVDAAGASAAPVVSLMPPCIRQSPKLKVVVVDSARCAQLYGRSCEGRFFEPMARHNAIATRLCSGTG